MRTRATLIKFAIFTVVMAMLTAFLFFIFGQYRTGATTGYSAVFTDVSRLKPGQSVRARRGAPFAARRGRTARHRPVPRDRTA